MNLKHFSDRELISELARRKTFMGLIIQVKRPLAPERQTAHNASLLLGKGLKQSQVSRLLRAALLSFDHQSPVPPLQSSTMLQQPTAMQPANNPIVSAERN